MCVRILWKQIDYSVLCFEHLFFKISDLFFLHYFVCVCMCNSVINSIFKYHLVLFFASYKCQVQFKCIVSLSIYLPVTLKCICEKKKKTIKNGINLRITRILIEKGTIWFEWIRILTVNWPIQVEIIIIWILISSCYWDNACVHCYFMPL